MNSSTFTKILRLSRPHIWIYTLGSFLMGVGIAYAQGFALHTTHTDSSITMAIVMICTTLWLTIPANLFLYAMNDACDTNTDLHNPKKQGLESRSTLDESGTLLRYTLVSLIAYIPILFLIDTTLILFFILWILLIYTYNLKPLRLKSIPFLDCFFSLNFPLWGVFGYYLTSSELPSVQSICVLSVLAIVFHIYTASGDILYDKEDGIITTAVYIGTYLKNILVSLVTVILLSLYLYEADSYASFQKILHIYTLFFLLNIVIYKYKKDYISPSTWYTLFLITHYISGIVFYIYFF